MKKIYISLGLLLIIHSAAIAQNNYSKIMVKAIKKAIGSDLKGYQSFSYPTDNFGIVTSYTSTADDGNFLCDTWNCLNVTTPPANDKAAWLNVNGFAAVGSGGAISFTKNQKKQLALKAILPKIYDVVGIGADASFESDVTTTLSFSSAQMRKLLKQQMITFINSQDDTKLIKQAFTNGTLVIAVSDCVVNDLTVTIKSKGKVGSKLDAKLGVAGTTVAAKIFQDASLTVSVEKTSEGEFTFKVSHPVIVARLIKKQPGAGVLGASDDFEDWTVITPLSEPTAVKP
ncbi:hypothetical protein GCM10027048_32550 [Hymenobacter coalescens]